MLSSKVVYLTSKVQAITSKFCRNSSHTCLAPPVNWPYPPVDLLGSLDALASTIEAGGFTSQYVLDQELAKLYTSVHEGHLYTQF